MLDQLLADISNTFVTYVDEVGVAAVCMGPISDVLCFLLESTQWPAAEGCGSW